MLKPLERLRSWVRTHWARSSRVWIWGQVIFIWGLAQGLPTDVLDQLPALKNICAPIVQSIPSVSSYIARSSFPQVTELVLCIGWILAPLNLAFGLLLPEHMHKGRPQTVFGNLVNIKPVDREFKRFFLAEIVLLVALPALLWMLLVVPIFDPKYGINDSALLSFTYRITFGFVAQAVSNIQGILAAAWFVVFGHFLGFFLSFFRDNKADHA